MRPHPTRPASAPPSRPARHARPARGLLACALAALATLAHPQTPPGTQGPADDPTPRQRPRPTSPDYKPGQRVEVLQLGNRWEPAQIKQAAGPLYLIALDGPRGQREFSWFWTDAPALRTPGQTVDVPPQTRPFISRVGNDSLRESRQAALAAYQKHLDDQPNRPTPPGSSGPGRPGPGTADQDDFPFPLTQPDTAAAQQITLQPGPTQPVEPDPATPLRRPVSLTVAPGSGGFHERAQTLAIHGPWAMVFTVDAPPGNKPKTQVVERFDLARARSLGQVPVPDGTFLLALDPAGQRAVGRSDGFGAGQQVRLDVWDFTPRGLEHLVSFQPAEPGPEPWRDVLQASFIDPQTLVVATKDNGLSAWSIAPGQATLLWRIRPGNQAAGAPTWQPSPGGRQLLLRDRDTLLLLEAATGQTLTTLAPQRGLEWFDVGFSPDGRHLAVRGRDRVVLWDLTQPDQSTSLGLPPGLSPGLLAFDDGSVAVGGQRYQLTTGQRIADYRWPRGTLRESRPGLYATVESPGIREPLALCVWPLPQPEAKPRRPAPKPAPGQADHPTRLLQPGQPMALDLDGLDMQPADRQALRQALEAQLVRRGLQTTTDPAAKLRLVGNSSTESEQRTYESVGGAPWQREQTTLDVEKKLTRLTLQIDGQPAWEFATATSPAMLLTVQEGQTVQDAVTASAAGRDVRVLDGLTLPDIIPDPRQPPPPTTTLTPNAYSP